MRRFAELGPNARGYRADVTIAEDRKRLFAALAKDFGKLDIVFANAGISGRTPTGSTDEAIFENVIHTNLNGAFFTVNSAAPLLNDNGSIIFNGSVHNYLGQPGVAAYAATKGGLVSMARSIAADLAPRNIRVNVVAPGATKTPIWKRGPRASISADRVRQVGEVLLVCHSAGPLGRAGRRCQSRALPCLGRFLVRQRGRADGGWRSHGCPVWSSHSSRLTAQGYGILRENGVVNGLGTRTRVIPPINQVTQRKGGKTMANLAIIVSNDRPIREERYPRTWLLYRDKDTIEIQMTHDSHNRPFVRDKNVA